MNFLPHIEELQKRLLMTAVFFLIASGVSYFFSHQLLEILARPLYQHSQEVLFFQKPYEAFLIHVKTAMLFGLFLSSPIWLTQLWLFIAPGLYERERNVFLPVLGASIALFATGILFAYFFVIPWGLKILLGFQTESLKPLLSAGAYFSFLNGMLLAFGVLFDFPVLLVGLIELGVLKTQQLREARKPMIVILFVVAAVLTPSPDPISQASLALPLWGLFEISIWVGVLREKKKNSDAEMPPG